MYVIGNDKKFLRINRKIDKFPSDISQCSIISVYYDCDIKTASTFKNYSEAKDTLDQIMNRRKSIHFSNENILKDMLESLEFDSERFVLQLQIIELIPRKINNRG